MQVMPEHRQADFGIKNLYDPQSNLEAGVQYLKFLLTRFDLTLALAAYNAGPATVRKYRRDSAVPGNAELRQEGHSPTFRATTASQSAAPASV